MSFESKVLNQTTSFIVFVKEWYFASMLNNEIMVNLLLLNQRIGKIPSFTKMLVVESLLFKPQA